MKKRGQVTIFIIVAIVIIAIIALFFLFRGGVVPGIGIGKETSPPSFLESCLEDKVKEAVEIISLQGGYVNNPLNKSFLFEDEDSPTDISYLCYVKMDGFLCVNQEPMLIQHLKNEIHNYIFDDVYDCFNNKLTKSLNKQGYTVVADYGGFEVELMEKKIVIDIDAELTLTKGGETTKQEEFKVIIGSRLYEIAEVANRAVNDEATVCNFDYVSFMRNNPEFDISKSGTVDSTEIYVIKHEDTNEKFNLAIRGCVPRF